jgi:hypothetical protein
MVTKDINVQSPDPDFTVPKYSLSHAIARLGGTPSAATIRSYVDSGVLKPAPFKDSQGRMLLSDKDIEAIRQVHEMRAKKWGRTVHRVTSTYMG